MLKKYFKTKIHYDFPCEYSIDDGGTWVSLAADIAHYVEADDLPASKMVKIRSNDATATSIDSAKAGFRDRSFDTIAFRNITGITNASYLAYKVFADTVIIGPSSIITSFKHVAAASVIKRLIFTSSYPSLTDMSYAFYRSSIGSISDLTIGGVNNLTVRNIVNYSDIGTMGSFTAKKVNSATYAFSLSKIEVFPNVDIEASNTIDLSYAFSRSTFDYGLYFSIARGPTTPLSRSLVGSYFLERLSAKFIGADLQLGSVTMPTAFSSSPNFMHPFCRMRTSYYGASPILNSGSRSNKMEVSLRGDIWDKLVTVAPIKNGVIENPDWLPKLTSFTKKQDYRYVAVQSIVLSSTGGMKIIGSFDTYDTEGFTLSLSMSGWNKKNLEYSSPFVIGSKNTDIYAEIDGADLSVRNLDNTLITTISGVSPIVGSISDDGTKLVLVTGDVADVFSGVDQVAPVNTITTYNVADGSVISTVVVTNDNNQFVMGIHQPLDGIFTKLLKTKYVIVGSAKAMDESTVHSYSDSLYAVEYANITLPEPYDRMLPALIESADCTVVNSASGDYTKIFGE